MNLGVYRPAGRAFSHQVENLLPLLPQLLHLPPDLGARLLELGEALLADVDDAPLPPDALPEDARDAVLVPVLVFPALYPALPAPALDLGPLDVDGEGAVRGAAPLDALGGALVEGGLGLQDDVGGRLGARVGVDRVPGGAGPAGEGEGELVGPEEEPGQGEEGAGHDARVGEVHPRPDHRFFIVVVAIIVVVVVVVGCEVGRGVLAHRGERVRQGEHVGQALGRLVGGGAGPEGLQVRGGEDVAHGLDARRPDYAAGSQGGPGRPVEEGQEAAGQEVVAEDAGGEDFSQQRFVGLYEMRHRPRR